MQGTVGDGDESRTGWAQRQMSDLSQDNCNSSTDAPLCVFLLISFPRLYEETSSPFPCFPPVTEAKKKDNIIHINLSPDEGFSRK